MGGQPKWFQVMVVYLKASSNEKTYSNYLWVVCNVEKEEVKEPLHKQPAASTNKPKVMSFFPLWKPKGSQPAMTPSAWVVHLEKESANKEECVNSEEPDGIKGITEEFSAHLARAVNSVQQEKCCYHCSSLDHFIWDCLLVVVSRTELHLNLKSGQHQRRESGPLKQRWLHWRCPRMGQPGHKMPNTDSLHESQSL